MKKQRKRIYAALLCICMMLSLVSAPVSAAETGEIAGSHEHTSECYTWAEKCVHEHSPECYPQESVSENGATPSEASEPIECTHICSEESGCITRELNCRYDGGSTSVTAETPQENEAGKETEQEQETEIAPPSNAQEVVTVESVQAMIDALPDAEEINADNAEEVEALLEAIDEAKTQLSDEELDTLDFSRYMAAAAVLGGLSAPMLTSSGTAEVSTAAELTSALADNSVSKITLTGNIEISSTLTVNRTVTLDLNGHVLQYKNDEVHGSPLAVEDGAHLTIKDSVSNATHKFTPNSDGLWVLDENGSETVTGGVITGGTGYQYTKTHPNGAEYTEEVGGGVCVKSGGKLTMEGGNIVGCTTSYEGGGVYVEGDFSMTGGSIIGCSAANDGGGVHVGAWNKDATFSMSGNAVIRDCRCKTDSSATSGGGVYALGKFTMSDNAAIRNCECITNSSSAMGGGVFVSYHDKPIEFTMSGDAVIENCKVTTSAQNSWTWSYGGGVYVSSRASLALKDNTKIKDCSAENTSGAATYGGGIFADSGNLTIAGSAEVGENCTAGIGGGIYMELPSYSFASQNLYANGGVIAGEVVLNNSSNYGGTIKIAGSNEGVTEFKGSVLNNSGTIEKGKFTGEVTNNGTITGGTFTGTVINSESGTIAEGVSIPSLKFIVTFDNDGTRTQEIINASSKLTEPTTPAKEGYRFDGWNYIKDDNTEAKWNFDTNTVTRAMTLTAQWKKTVSSTPIIPGDIRYIVEHYKASGSGYTLEETEYFTGSIGDTVTATPKTYDGFTYNSSISTSSGTLKNISSAADIVTLKLYYDRTVYTVTVENDGNGSASAAPAFATMDEEITLTATPNSGYRFKAWEVVSGGVTISENKFTMPAANVTIKALFERKSSGGGGTTYYTLIFDTNGGSSISAVRGIYGKTINLSSYVPTRDGYDFIGWYSDKTLTQKITEIKLNGSKTVYAGWTKSNPNTGVNPFTDVKAGDWFYNDVMFVYEKGLMSGTSATTFAPYANTTRAQIAVIFYRMEGSPAVEGKNNFTDVEYGPGTAWFYDAVTWVQQNGIMGGYGNGKFGPDDSVTREQLASIFYRYAQYKGYDTTQGGMAIREFDDYGSISSYAMDAMTWAVNIGLIKGGDNNLLNPNGTATRAEIAAMLHRFIEARN